MQKKWIFFCLIFLCSFEWTQSCRFLFLHPILETNCNIISNNTAEMSAARHNETDNEVEICVFKRERETGRRERRLNKNDFTQFH